MNNMKVIGDKLKQIRMKRNLRQREVAKQLGITREEISYIERGVRNISLTRLEELLKIYGLSLSSFFEDKEEIDILKVRFFGNPKKLTKEDKDNIAFAKRFTENLYELDKKNKEVM